MLKTSVLKLATIATLGLIQSHSSQVQAATQTFAQFVEQRGFVGNAEAVKQIQRVLETPVTEPRLSRTVFLIAPDGVGASWLPQLAAEYLAGGLYTANLDFIPDRGGAELPLYPLLGMPRGYRGHEEDGGPLVKHLKDPKTAVFSFENIENAGESARLLTALSTQPTFTDYTSNEVPVNLKNLFFHSARELDLLSDYDVNVLGVKDETGRYLPGDYNGSRTENRLKRTLIANFVARNKSTNQAGLDGFIDALPFENVVILHHLSESEKALILNQRMLKLQKEILKSSGRAATFSSDLKQCLLDRGFSFAWGADRLSGIMYRIQKSVTDATGASANPASTTMTILLSGGCPKNDAIQVSITD